MKKIITFILSATLLLTLASCDKWLDINVDPNTPTSSSAKYYNRLPFCQFYLEHSWTIPGTNVAYYSQMLVSRAGQTQNATRWDVSGSNRANNAQQWFFVPVAGNLKEMYDSAMEAGAYHYAGAARMMRAFGFMDMVDLFGEIPYTDALGESVAPVYDTGDVVFKGCIDDIEEAISLFSKEQDITAEPLASGDSWNGGDTQKWLKMCYLLKARWLVKLSKKGTGSYKDLKYDAEEILNCLAKAQTSNADNTIIRHQNVDNPTHDHEGWNETVSYSGTYSTIGMNTNNFWVSKMMYDNLTNFAGYGVEDPRADAFIPWSRSKKGPNSPAGIKWSDDGKWRRSLPVDLSTSIMKDNGPFTALNFENGAFYMNGAPDTRLGDTVYVKGRADWVGYDQIDPLYHVGKTEDAVLSSNFFLRPDSPTVMASYAEACLIKAEVLFNKGDKANAFKAYKAGIEANIKMVNEWSAYWRGEYAAMAECPSVANKTDAEINNFLSNGIGTEENISLAKIMTQKQILYILTLESWNDMRRYDFDPNVFMGFSVPYYYLNTPAIHDYLPVGKYPRRWNQASYERDYNAANLKAIGEKVPGAMELPTGSDGAWYNSKQIYTLPVWWDRAE